MKFKYQAKNKQGELQVGLVEAGSRDGAIQILGGHDLFVLSVETEGAPNIIDRISDLFTNVKTKDMVIFSRQLATFLDARVPLNNALKILVAQTSNPKLKEAIAQVTEDIDAGLSFSKSMERHTKVFPSYYVEMMRAAEVTGNMNEVAKFLADYTEKESILISKASSALIYPAIVFALFFVVAFILIAFVYPSLGAVFAQNGVSLPWYTEVLLATGNFLNSWWPVILIGVGVLGFVGSNYIQTEEGKALLDEAKIRFPIAKKVYRAVIMARLGNSAGLLVRGGIPIAQALEIISHMVGNILYRDVVHEVAEDVRQGMLLSQSLAKHPEYFPELVPQMVAVGETTGKMEDMFASISRIYTRDADELTNNLVDILQPILMIGMGVMVGGLFASILIPIYHLTENIH